LEKLMGLYNPNSSHANSSKAKLRRPLSTEWNSGTNTIFKTLLIFWPRRFTAHYKRHANYPSNSKQRGNVVAGYAYRPAARIVWARADDQEMG
jgi:hypothetical protein